MGGEIDGSDGCLGRNLKDQYDCLEFDILRMRDFITIPSPSLKGHPW